MKELIEEINKKRLDDCYDGQKHSYNMAIDDIVEPIEFNQQELDAPNGDGWYYIVLERGVYVYVVMDTGMYEYEGKWYPVEDYDGKWIKVVHKWYHMSSFPVK